MSIASLGGTMRDGDIIQVAHLVRDIRKTMKHWWEDFGVGPWNVYTFGPGTVRESRVRGKPSDHLYLLALAWSRDLQYELIQPVTGRSIYDEHLERKGEGIHHIKLYFKDCKAAIARYAATGIEVIQSGKIDEDEFYYLDTEPSLGTVIELGNNGRIRDPEWRFPSR